MGKMTLGLDDRSARLIHGRDVWTEIKDLLSGYSNIQAAIAFVGADADQYLALRGPATIVVNAGDDALRDGATDPEVLLRWTRRGVRVYSLRTLHAKVVLAEGTPAFVLVGSADVLSASGRQRDEAVLVADERETVDELRDVITEWRRHAGEPLTEAWLQAAASRYRPAAPHRLAVPQRPAGPERGVPPSRLPAPAPERVLPDGRTITPQRPPEPGAGRSFGFGSPLPERFASPHPVISRTPAVEPVNESATADEFGGDAVPAAVPEQVVEPDPVARPGSVVEPDAVAQAAAVTELVPAPDVGADAEPEASPSSDLVAPVTEGGENGRPDPEAEPLPAVLWPRPKYIYLATLTRDGRASDAAVERLEQLRADFRVPKDGPREPILDVEMFWWDEPARSSGRPNASYREGWHVVPISVPASGRPAVLSAVDSPGRVLHSFTDYLGGPARTYYYLLKHSAGPSTTFRKLREALTAVGEKPSYDHAYMMQHKVAAILDLWPQITYTD